MTQTFPSLMRLDNPTPHFASGRRRRWHPLVGVAGVPGSIEPVAEDRSASSHPQAPSAVMVRGGALPCIISWRHRTQLP